MSDRPGDDPASATPLAGAGSRRPRPVLVVAAAVLLAALVQAFVAQTYVVPSAALAPTVDPGERLLVWKAGGSPTPGDLVVVDTTGTAAVDRSTPVDDGPVGSVLGTVAGWLRVDIGAQSVLALVGSANGEVTVVTPAPRTVPREDVVGRVVWRVWPLDRLGPVDTGGAR